MMTSRLSIGFLIAGIAGIALAGSATADLYVPSPSGRCEGMAVRDELSLSADDPHVDVWLEGSNCVLRFCPPLLCAPCILIKPHVEY
jgi:hypothetical protein